jgi:hypothetical protein
MPWHIEAMKDVASCDKPRRGASTLRPADLRMGEPTRVLLAYPRPNKIGRRERTRGSEPSQYPEEKKTTVIPSVAASERGRA